jgi:hypothetical protein
MWLEIWSGCHTSGFAGPMRLAWPDGKSLIEQPAIAVKVFDMVGDQVSKSAAQGRPQ